MNSCLNSWADVGMGLRGAYMMVCRWDGKVVRGVYTHDGMQVGWEGGEGSLYT